ncbi:hypothetical protein ADK64_13505 [Streptomyces sp. MMG1121]|nr:hypothetical protein ADK64_13505 [Streptomyces sp. MMG1121]
MSTAAAAGGSHQRRVPAAWPRHRTYPRTRTRAGTATWMFPRSESSSENRSGRTRSRLRRASRCSSGPCATTCQVDRTNSAMAGRASSRARRTTVDTAPSLADS